MCLPVPTSQSYNGVKGPSAGHKGGRRAPAAMSRGALPSDLGSLSSANLPTSRHCSSSCWAPGPWPSALTARPSASPSSSQPRRPAMSAGAPPAERDAAPPAPPVGANAGPGADTDADIRTGSLASAPAPTPPHPPSPPPGAPALPTPSPSAAAGGSGRRTSRTCDNCRKRKVYRAPCPVWAAADPPDQVCRKRGGRRPAVQRLPQPAHRMHI